MDITSVLFIDRHWIFGNRFWVFAGLSEITQDSRFWFFLGINSFNKKAPSQVLLKSTRIDSPNPNHKN